MRNAERKDNSYPALYIRSSVLGGQVVAELDQVGGVWQWQRGYVYAGAQLLAVQSGGVFFVHEDPITKSKRVTSMSGAVQSSIELDPYGAEVTGRSSNSAFQPRKFTSYERDANGTDEAMFRCYNRWHSRFDQPDPYDGSYDMTDPQSFNRYAYVQNDPVNFVDPTGLCLWVPTYLGESRGWEYVAVLCNDNPARPQPEMGPPVESPGGGEPQNTEPGINENNACETMAAIAQAVAKLALDFWGNAKDALTAFDMDFSRKYLGNTGIGTTYSSAWTFNGNIRVGGAPVLGDSGFKSEFIDGEGDQTHHFAGHLTAGINNQLAAHRAQKVTDTFNPADRRLSNAAYKIGQDLRKDPKGLFSVGDRILKDICAPK